MKRGYSPHPHRRSAHLRQTEHRCAPAVTRPPPASSSPSSGRGRARRRPNAIVTETEPSADAVVAGAPERVVIRFNEDVETTFGGIRVYDTRGNRPDAGRTGHVGGRDAIAVDLEDGLPDGTYTVTWRVVSADGHPVEEAFVFHVGAPGERPEGIAATILAGEHGAGRLEDALAALARALLFAGIIVLVGAFASARWARDEGRITRVARRLAGWGLVAAVAGTVTGFVLQGAVAGDLSLVRDLSSPGGSPPRFHADPALNLHTAWTW